MSPMGRAVRVCPSGAFLTDVLDERDPDIGERVH